MSKNDNELPNEEFFPLSNRYSEPVKCCSPIFIAAVIREIYSFMKFIQFIIPNYN